MKYHEGYLQNYRHNRLPHRIWDGLYQVAFEHQKVVPLNHRTIVGSADDLWVSDPDFPRKAQFIMGKILYEWIDSWPLE